jgi:hypothetical protein
MGKFNKKRASAKTSTNVICPKIVKKIGEKQVRVKKLHLPLE